eukprot:1129023-Pleurochrysis_carterae.AAC.1
MCINPPPFPPDSPVPLAKSAHIRKKACSPCTRAARNAQQEVRARRKRGDNAARLVAKGQYNFLGLMLLGKTSMRASECANTPSGTVMDAVADARIYALKEPLVHSREPRLLNLCFSDIDCACMLRVLGEACTHTGTRRALSDSRECHKTVQSEGREEAAHRAVGVNAAALGAHGKM